MSSIKLFEEKSVRSVFNEQEEEWYFSMVYVVEGVLEGFKKAITCRRKSNRYKL